jgi:hypothetical protein
VADRADEGAQRGELDSGCVAGLLSVRSWRVDESGRSPTHRSGFLMLGIAVDEERRGKACRGSRRYPCGMRAGGNVGNQASGGSGGGELVGKPPRSEAVHGAPVGHAVDGLGCFCRYQAHGRDRGGNAIPAAQSNLVGGADHGAVEPWVDRGYSHFEEARAAAGEGNEGFCAGRHVRISGHREGPQHRGAGSWARGCRNASLGTPGRRRAIRTSWRAACGHAVRPGELDHVCDVGEVLLRLRTLWLLGLERVLAPGRRSGRIGLEGDGELGGRVVRRCCR